MAPWKSGLADCGQLALALATIREDSSVNTARAPPPFAFSFLGYLFLQVSYLILSSTIFP